MAVTIVSAINEAYARIDYSLIKDLQSQINDLRKEIYRGSISHIRKNDYSVNETRIWAGAIIIESKSSDTAEVKFGGIFDSVPVVTATVYDPTKSVADTEGATIVMRNLSEKGVTLDIYRKKKGRMIVHVIAVGANES